MAKGPPRRKDQLKALFGGDAPAPAPATSRERETSPARDAKAAPVAPPPAPRPAAGRSGAVRAMGLSLGNVGSELAAARAEVEALREGERVVEIDPASVEPSPVRDRLSRGALDDERFAELVSSMRETGQQVPILVRPHPEGEGKGGPRFQAAYGHRRLLAAQQLGQPVRAVVRPLDDEALALAQGQENAERRDLSFIERAMFARALIERGLDRAAVMRATSLHKAELSRMLQVAEAIPPHVARAIGPAPKAGRPRWMKLAEALRGEAARARAAETVADEAFRALPSDRRFAAMLERVSAPAAAPAGEAEVVVRDEKGQALARLSRRNGRAVLVVDDATHPGLAQHLADRLPAIAAAFERGSTPSDE